MKSRGITTWFAMDSMIHVSPKVLHLAELLHLDVDTTVGKLARLWAWAKLAQNERGELGRLPDEELAGIMRWKKKPELLTRALLEAGLLERGAEGGLIIHGWYEVNGKSAEKARHDRERKRAVSRDTNTDTNTKTKTDTAFSSCRARKAEPKDRNAWMADYL